LNSSSRGAAPAAVAASVGRAGIQIRPAAVASLPAEATPGRAIGTRGDIHQRTPPIGGQYIQCTGMLICPLDRGSWLARDQCPEVATVVGSPAPSGGIRRTKPPRRPAPVGICTGARSDVRPRRCPAAPPRAQGAHSSDNTPPATPSARRRPMTARSRAKAWQDATSSEESCIFGCQFQLVGVLLDRAAGEQLSRGSSPRRRWSRPAPCASSASARRGCRACPASPPATARTASSAESSYHMIS